MNSNVVLSLEFIGMSEKLRVNFCISTKKPKTKTTHFFSNWGFVDWHWCIQNTNIIGNTFILVLYNIPSLLNLKVFFIGNLNCTILLVIEWSYSTQFLNKSYYISYMLMLSNHSEWILQFLNLVYLVTHN